MKRLAAQIKRELETQAQEIGHCAIYEDELQRLWPIDVEKPESKDRAIREGTRISLGVL